MNELIILRDNAYNAFCQASVTQLADLIEQVSKDMPEGETEKITIVCCCETRRETKITVSAPMRRSCHATAKAALRRIGVYC